MEQILARLSGQSLQIHFAEMVTRQLELESLLTDKTVGWRLSRAVQNKRRVTQEAWYWPLSLLPEVVRELQQPGVRSLTATERFLAAGHLLACIVEPRRRFSGYLPRAVQQEYPFVVVALAVLHGKSRQLDHPRVPDRQLRDLSDVEFRVAGLLWGITGFAYRELVKQLQQQRIARVCAHCGSLSADLGRKYCSDLCMKAADRRRRHLRKPSKRA